MINISQIFYPVVLVVIFVAGMAWLIHDHKTSEKWVKEGRKK